MTTNPHHEVATPDCAILNLKQQGKCFLVFFRKDKIRGQTIRGSYYSEIFLFGSLLFQLKQFFFFYFNYFKCRSMTIYITNI